MPYKCTSFSDFRNIHICLVLYRDLNKAISNKIFYKVQKMQIKIIMDEAMERQWPENGKLPI